MFKYVSNQENIMMTCPECGSKSFKTRIGEVSCKNCGLIVEEELIMSG